MADTAQNPVVADPALADTLTDMIRVRVRQQEPAGEHDLSLPRDASVADLKSRVASVSGVPPSTQRLIFRGRVLISDDQLVKNVPGFNDGDAMHVVTSQPSLGGASVGLNDSARPSGEGVHFSGGLGVANHQTTNTARTVDGVTQHQRVVVNSASLSVPAHALGALDIPGVVNQLLMETFPLDVSNFMARHESGSNARANAAASVVLPNTGTPTLLPNNQNTQHTQSAYADPTLTAMRHARFVYDLALEIASDPHGVSMGDGTHSGSDSSTQGSTRTGATTSQETSPCTHFGVQCDTCGVVPIVGVRYKSTTRADYDLCDTCHGAASRGVAPVEGPFVALASPLPGLVPPPTAAPAGMVDGNWSVTSATNDLGNQPDSTNNTASGTEMERHALAMRRRMPPVMTTAALADALENASRAVRATLPGIEAAAAALREVNATSTTHPSTSAPQTQGQVLRASMALHASGSLLMELARLASSVQVTGAAAPAPEFIRSGAAAMRASGGGGGADSNETATSPGVTTLGFLAPPLVYLDPRGGTQPLSGLGTRQSVLSSIGVGRVGGGAHFAAGGQRPSAASTAAAALADATAAVAAARGTMGATTGGATAGTHLPGAGATPQAQAQAQARATQNQNLNPLDPRTVHATMQNMTRSIQQLNSQIHAQRHEIHNHHNYWLRQALVDGNRDGHNQQTRRGALATARGALAFVFRRGPFRVRQTSGGVDFPERAAGGGDGGVPAPASPPGNQRAPPLTASPRPRGINTPTRSAETSPNPSATPHGQSASARTDDARTHSTTSETATNTSSAQNSAAAALTSDPAAAARRSTFTFSFDTNVRMVPTQTPVGGGPGVPSGQTQFAPVAGQGSAVPTLNQAVPQPQPQQPQPQQPQPQATQPQGTLSAQHISQAAAAHHAAVQASFTQGIGALLHHLQQGGGSVPAGTRMRVVPTSEGGFTLEPILGETGAASSTTTATSGANAQATPIPPPSPPTTPAPAPPPVPVPPPPSSSVPVSTPTVAATPTTASTPVSVPVAQTPPVRSTDTASAATGVGLGSGLPPRRAREVDRERTPTQKPPNVLPRQDSLD